MRYFVVGADGNRYGPADMAMLNDWIRQGRLLPEFFLEEEGTGRRVMAGHMPGLAFAPQPGAGPNLFQGMNMPVSQAAEADAWLRKAVNYGVLGTVLPITVGICCNPVGFAGLALGILGLGYVQRAKALGQTQVGGATALNIVAIILGGLTLVGMAGGFLSSVFGR